MSEQINMDSNAIYVIGRDYNLVYVNEVILKKMPEVRTGDYCYWALCHENAPCKNCPLEQKEKGGSVFWNKRFDMWVNATAGALDWPGEGLCHLIVSKPIDMRNAMQANTEINSLTGLYYNHSFFRQVDKKLRKLENGTYCLAAIDIEHFRLFNKLYGREEGDKLLVHIAEYVKEMQDMHGGVAGYLGGDNFAILMPNDQELLQLLYSQIIKDVREMNTIGFLPGFGVYEIVDTTMSAVVMYDRATIALSHIIGNRTKRICMYDDSMVEDMEEELDLLTEIQAGLEYDEFTFFVQPQCDIFTGKIVGAEALVRWKHRTKGMIPPGIFIPVLEKNGFISDLDKLVWRKVCEWTRQWIDRGYQPVPISINVSRIDIFSMDVPDYLEELLKTYHLEPSNLKIEITEGAYAENNDKIVDTVKRLQTIGFLVMMDDFGSGYSSLNMLKSVSVDVIKIDMKFLDFDEQEDGKAISILETVVNMSRQMGLPIIVEGVETKMQEEFLRGLGCRYTQGYYYYRPLPIEEFENLLSDESRLDPSGILYHQVDEFRMREFLDENLFNDTMINNILGAAVFYDLYENKVEILRVNNQYYQLVGALPGEENRDQNRLWDHVHDDDRTTFLSLFERAHANPAEGAQGNIHLIRQDDAVIWVYVRIFFLREKEGHKIFYSSLTDITMQREKQLKDNMEEHPVKALEVSERPQLDRYFGDMPCGYGVIKVILDEKEDVTDYQVVYVNHELECMTGSSEKRLHKFLVKMFAEVRQELLQKAYQAAYMGDVVNHYVFSPTDSRHLQLTLYQYEQGYAGCILRDVTHARIYEEAMRSVVNSYREVYYIHLEGNYYRMIYPDENQVLERGNYEAAMNRHFRAGRIVDDENTDDLRYQLSVLNLKNELTDKDRVEFKYRRRFGDKIEWCLSTFTVNKRVNGRPQTVTLTIRSIEDLVKDEERRYNEQLAKTLAYMSEGFCIYRATEGEELLFANPPLQRLYGCGSLQEFRDLVGNSFRGMVHPEDLERVESEIAEQIRHSEENMDYAQYRIIRKDGEERWVDDWGHLEMESGPDGKLFYVFIYDITDKITEQQKNKLLNANKPFNK